MTKQTQYQQNNQVYDRYMETSFIRINQDHLEKVLAAKEKARENAINAGVMEEKNR